MSALDVTVAITFLAATAGPLAFRVLRAWRRFRLQARTVELLARGLTELEKPEARPHR